MPGVGYRMIVRYKEDQFCLDATGNDGKWVCTNTVPAFLDLQLSFGLLRRLDLIADVRLGLAREADAKGVGRQTAVAPGIRVWLDWDRPVKIYTTAQVVYDWTTQGQRQVNDSDYGLRNANGVIYDVTRNFGAFFQLGETLAFARWFRMEIDVGLGVQVRLP